MATQRCRLEHGGRIDRSRPLSFTFDGGRHRAYAGDTLASALLANGIHLVGRSFKYHRPRGILTAGPEEPNALVQLGTGVRTEPNCKAPMVELFEGLEARSQNRWPSLGFDIGQVNDVLSPLFPAGFYYKTFISPGGMWPTYEYFIRKAAGLGKSPQLPDPDRYDHCYAHCDILVVGGGPAGLAAASAAERTGARVILADDRAAFGGALLAEPAEGGTTIGGEAAEAWMSSVVTRLEGAPEVMLLPRTTAFGYYDHNHLQLLERVGEDPDGVMKEGRPRQRLWKVRASRVVLATGAIERPLVFENNDRPGIMLAGAVRRYLNHDAVRPGQRAVVVTNNDSAYATALDLQSADVTVEAIIDLRAAPEGELPGRAREAGLRILAGRMAVGAEGSHRVRRITVASLNEAGDALAGTPQSLPCDLVCMSGGWTPAVHLFSQSRGTLRYDDAIGAFVPETSVQAEQSAGACKGVFDLAGCLVEGSAAGTEAARSLGYDVTEPETVSTTAPMSGPQRHLWVIETGARSKRFVDFQGDVTDKDIRLAAREGYRSVEHFKRYTTTGMGNDQGKTSNMQAFAILADATGKTIPEIGTTTFRQPYTPVTFGAIAGRGKRNFYDATRKTPIHRWHEEHGALFEDVGQWKRPWYYPRADEDMHAAVSREVKAARTSVGILDATTLGKIDIHGRDAAVLLNRVYSNAWSKLEVGRARYGLMLSEDGMVMDDGVTLRLAEHHYLMSATTGNAARVLAWLEEYLQTEWPELEIYCTSTTEQWATVSICGPHSRKLLGELSEGVDLAPDAFPHMTMREGRVAGIPARVVRVSFTGEMSYEINVAANCGLAVWSACMSAGEKYGITPFGTEGMHVLRAEKGFIIVGQDTDGTVTAQDLGMEWIVSKKKKDFIGKRSFMRPDTARSNRKQLVGLFTDNPDQVLMEGAQIVAALERKPPMKMIGHVSSAYYSPNVGRSIALALIERGRERMGEKLYAPMPDKVVPVTVTNPVFFDPENERLKA